jgi:hypothetical protein
MTPIFKTVDQQVVSEAKKDAAIFVEEFGEALDPSETDWDGVAWDDVSKNLGIYPDEHGVLWEVYQTELVLETERLTRGKA